MRTENVEFKHRGKTVSGQIAWPESLEEAIRVLDPVEIWAAFIIGYRSICRKRILNITPPPQRYVRIDLSLLSPEERQALLTWKANAEISRSPQPQQAEKSAPPLQQPTDQIDSDEMPEEAQASASESAESFEEDFAKYLASRNS